MRILVTFAVDAEFAPWRKLRQFQRKASAEMEYSVCQVGGVELGVLLTGIGGKKAWTEATRIIWDSDVDVCISSGLAGGLRPEHRAGEILAAEKVVAAGSVHFVTCNASLLQCATDCGAKRVRSFYTANRVIVESKEKRELGAIADAVEMESSEILQEAAAFGARGIAVRAISDTADEDLPLDFNRLASDSGDVSLLKVFGEVVASPSSIPALVRFGRRSQVAAESLAGFLERYVSTLAPVLTQAGAAR